MDNSREMINEILKISRKIEIKLDDILPDIYSYIANYAEGFAYDKKLWLDSFELKNMINRSFSTTNNNFLQEIDFSVNKYLNILTRKLENGKEIENDLMIIKDELTRESQNKLNYAIEKGVEIFEDNYYQEYIRRFQSDEIIYLGKILTRKLEDEMSEITGQIKLIINNSFDEAMVKYQSEKINNKSNELESLINDVYEQYKTEIEATILAKMAFLDFEYFCRDLISKGITPGNINDYDSRQLENLMKILREQIQKNHEKNQTIKETSQEIKEERQSKPKHMREVMDGEMVLNTPRKPKHFKVEEPEITQEQIDEMARKLR
mgnify:CR=1 FL=1